MFHAMGSVLHMISFKSFLKKYFTYLFLERGEGRERNINQWLLTHPQLRTCPRT